jgi:hypothetical protein
LLILKGSESVESEEFPELAHVLVGEEKKDPSGNGHKIQGTQMRKAYEAKEKEKPKNGQKKEDDDGFVDVEALLSQSKNKKKKKKRRQSNGEH